MKDTHTHGRDRKRHGEEGSLLKQLQFYAYLLTYLEKCLLDAKKNDKEEGRKIKK